MDPLFLRTEHGVTLLDIESIEEGLEIANGYIDPVLGKRMRIHVGETGLLLIGNVLSPDLAI